MRKESKKKKEKTCLFQMRQWHFIIQRHIKPCKIRRMHCGRNLQAILQTVIMKKKKLLQPINKKTKTLRPLEAITDWWLLFSAVKYKKIKIVLLF